MIDTAMQKIYIYEHILKIMKKFEGVKIEKDKFSQHIKIKNYDCRQEVWQWDGIQAQSLIFCKSDFSDQRKKIFINL